MAKRIRLAARLARVSCSTRALCRLASPRDDTDSHAEASQGASDESTLFEARLQHRVSRSMPELLATHSKRRPRAGARDFSTLLSSFSLLSHSAPRYALRHLAPRDNSPADHRSVNNNARPASPTTLAGSQSVREVLTRFPVLCTARREVALWRQTFLPFLLKVLLAQTLVADKTTEARALNVPRMSQRSRNQCRAHSESRATSRLRHITL